jgi:hypothetical protein
LLDTQLSNSLDSESGPYPSMSTCRHRCFPLKPMRLLLLTFLLFVSLRALGDQPPPENTGSIAGIDASADHASRTLRGRVVWLDEALRSDFEISTVPEFKKAVLALRTSEAELFPIVENIRGRAFRKDDRLREMHLELLVRQYRTQPFVQILKVYQIDAAKKFEIDYWCDICAIPMYETGPCACCQDHNRLRKREVDPVSGETAEH